MSFSFSPTADDKAGSNFDPIPAGWYTVQIASAKHETKQFDTSKASIALQLKVQGPSHIGRVIFARFNIKHPNPETVRIARQQLNGLCVAIGKPDGFRDPQELVGHFVEAKVTVRPEQNGYDASNDVKGYRKAEGFSAPATASAPAGAPKANAADFDDSPF